MNDNELRAVRREAGLTQTEAAQLVYASVRAWQYWESGKVPMPEAKRELFLAKIKIGRTK